MATLRVDDGFDVHEYRSSLKLVRQDDSSLTLENRDDLACPACERPFERLFVTGDSTVSFSSTPNGPICVARTDQRTLVLTH